MSSTASLNVSGAFLTGCAACANGERRDSNPHQSGSALFGYWAKGWMDEFRRLPEALQRVRLVREPGLLSDAPPEAGQENG